MISIVSATPFSISDIERYEPAEGDLDADAGEALAGLVEAGEAIARIEGFTRRTAPDVAT